MRLSMLVPLMLAPSIAFAQSGFEAHNVLDYNADPTGVVDSAPAFAAAVGSGNVKVVIPCGIYLLKANTALPSNTEIAGAGTCTVLKVASDMAPNDLASNLGLGGTPGRTVFSNATWPDPTATSPLPPRSEEGDTHITIHDVKFMNGGLSSGQYFFMMFYRANHIDINHVVCEGLGTLNDGNCAGYVNVSQSRFNNNTMTGAGLEGNFDIWDGSHDIVIADNDCDGNGVARCYTVNGLSSGSASQPHKTNTSYNVALIGNISRNTARAAFEIAGLKNPEGGEPGYVRNIQVVGNTVDGTTTLPGTPPVYGIGIWVGDAQNITVSGNTIRNSQGPCILLQSATTGRTDHVSVTANGCQNPVASDALFGAISVGSGADAPDSIIIADNSVSGEYGHVSAYDSYGRPTDSDTHPITVHYPYAIWIHPGVTNTTLIPGNLTAGTAGTILNSGTGTRTVANLADAQTWSAAQTFSAGATFGGSTTLGAGTSFSGAIRTPISSTAKTANYTIVASDDTVLMDATPGALLAWLPPCLSSNSGARYSVVKTDSSGNTVSFARSTAQPSDTINGTTAIALTTQYAGATARCDGAGHWYKF